MSDYKLTDDIALKALKAFRTDKFKNDSASAEALYEFVASVECGRISPQSAITILDDEALVTKLVDEMRATLRRATEDRFEAIILAGNTMIAKNLAISESALAGQTAIQQDQTAMRVELSTLHSVATELHQVSGEIKSSNAHLVVQIGQALKNTSTKVAVIVGTVASVVGALAYDFVPIKSTISDLFVAARNVLNNPVQQQSLSTIPTKLNLQCPVSNNNAWEAEMLPNFEPPVQGKKFGMSFCVFPAQGNRPQQQHLLP